MILFLLLAPFIIHTILLMLIMALVTMGWEAIKTELGAGKR